jgi:hypothetical protein
MTPPTSRTCYCGCGATLKVEGYFQTGHDKKAEGDLNAILHGDSVAQRLIDFGYGPDGRNLHEHAIELGLRERCGIGDCRISGVPGSYGLRRHRATHNPGPASGRGAD